MEVVLRIVLEVHVVVQVLREVVLLKVLDIDPNIILEIVLKTVIKIVLIIVVSPTSAFISSCALFTLLCMRWCSVGKAPLFVAAVSVTAGMLRAAPWLFLHSPAS